MTIRALGYIKDKVSFTYLSLKTLLFKQGGKKMSSSSFKRPSVISYFNAILLPFLYFFTRKRAIAGIVSLIICIISLPLMFFIVGFFTYFAMSIWATWNLRYELMNVHVTEQAQAIAEQMASIKEKQ